jgi:hypothetical protein
MRTFATRPWMNQRVPILSLVIKLVSARMRSKTPIYQYVHFGGCEASNGTAGIMNASLVRLVPSWDMSVVGQGIFSVHDMSPFCIFSPGIYFAECIFGKLSNFHFCFGHTFYRMMPCGIVPVFSVLREQ